MRLREFFGLEGPHGGGALGARRGLRRFHRTRARAGFGQRLQLHGVAARPRRPVARERGFGSSRSWRSPRPRTARGSPAAQQRSAWWRPHARSARPLPSRAAAPRRPRSRAASGCAAGAPSGATAPGGDGGVAGGPALGAAVGCVPRTARCSSRHGARRTPGSSAGRQRAAPRSWGTAWWRQLREPAGSLRSVPLTGCVPSYRCCSPPERLDGGLDHASPGSGCINGRSARPSRRDDFVKAPRGRARGRQREEGRRPPCQRPSVASGTPANAAARGPSRARGRRRHTCASSVTAVPE